MLADAFGVLVKRGLERGARQGRLDVGRPLQEDPVHEPQFKGTAMTDAGHAAVGHGVDGNHGDEVRRSQLGECMLSPAVIAGVEGANFAAGPGLLGDPSGANFAAGPGLPSDLFDHVEAVLRVTDQHPPGPFAVIAASDVVYHDHVAMLA